MNSTIQSTLSFIKLTAKKTNLEKHSSYRNLILAIVLALFTLTSYAQPGCMDSSAINWDPSATSDDGSCQYTDSDGDGLDDYEEVNTYGTDPNNSDTDYENRKDREPQNCRAQPF
jgi:hypothetical protein